MQLLLDHPLWIVIILVTLLLHLGFFLAIRRILGKAADRSKTEDTDQR